MALPKVFVTRQILDPALELISQSASVWQTTGRSLVRQDR